jgi:hypothetical protein
MTAECVAGIEMDARVKAAHDAKRISSIRVGFAVAEILRHTVADCFVVDAAYDRIDPETVTWRKK